mmetsp:Transcript_54110/g.116161  ORF Transcript_54110/g.116161 Transcript_54110/m.116161 type:complete len:218 (-) Transcript_54110:1295-1948(-)
MITDDHQPLAVPRQRNQRRRLHSLGALIDEHAGEAVVVEHLHPRTHTGGHGDLLGPHGARQHHVPFGGGLAVSVRNGAGQGPIVKSTIHVVADCVTHPIPDPHCVNPKCTQLGHDVIGSYVGIGHSQDLLRRVHLLQPSGDHSAGGVGLTGSRRSLNQGHALRHGLGHRPLLVLCQRPGGHRGIELDALHALVGKLLRSFRSRIKDNGPDGIIIRHT